MYSDKDGIATTRSQAVYNAHTRKLLAITSLLSWLGFCAAVLNGEYSRENFTFPLSLKQPDLLSWNKFLWASYTQKGTHMLLSSVTGTKYLLSLSSRFIVSPFTGKTILSTPMPPG